MKHDPDHHHLRAQHVPTQRKTFDGIVQALVGMFDLKVRRKGVGKGEQLLVELHDLGVRPSSVELLKVVCDIASETSEA